VLKEECNQVISVCKMDISFKITVKQKCIHLTESILNPFQDLVEGFSMISLVRDMQICVACGHTQ